MDVRLSLDHTLLIVVPPTLQILHQLFYYHFSSLKLLSSTTCNYLHTASRQRDISAQNGIKATVQPAKRLYLRYDFSTRMIAFFFLDSMTSIPPMPGKSACKLSAHPDAVVGTNDTSMTGKRLLRSSEQFIHMDHKCAIACIHSKIERSVTARNTGKRWTCAH